MMKDVMKEFHRAIMWTGVDAMVSMFVASRISCSPHLNFRRHKKWDIKKETVYLMEDPDGVMPDHSVYEHDFALESIPDDLEGFLRCCIEDALTNGAEVAWCAFEGAFHFWHLLEPEFAASVYAVGDSEGVCIAFDKEKRTSEEWINRVSTALASLVDSRIVDELRRNSEL